MVDETKVLETTEEVVVEETTVEETPEEVVEETKVEETVEESGDFKITKEEYDKAIQSASSKAKHSILKEIGVDKVETIKELIDKGAKFEDVVKELQEIKESNESLNTKIRQKEDDELAKKFSIPSNAKDFFIKLVDEVDGDLTREEKAEIVKEKISLLSGGIGSLGTPKTNEKDLTEAELMAKYRNL